MSAISSEASVDLLTLLGPERLGSFELCGQLFHCVLDSGLGLEALLNCALRVGLSYGRLIDHNVEGYGGDVRNSVSFEALGCLHYFQERVATIGGSVSDLCLDAFHQGFDGSFSLRKELVDAVRYLLVVAHGLLLLLLQMILAGELCGNLLSVKLHGVDSLSSVQLGSVYSYFTHIGDHAVCLGVAFRLLPHPEDVCVGHFPGDLVHRNDLLLRVTPTLVHLLFVHFPEVLNEDGFDVSLA